MPKSNDSKICRWGFVSTAGIGKKNWHAIQCCENATLVAVASRNESTAREFIDACQSQEPMDTIPDAMVGYESLLQRDDIDAVYIPLPTALRKSWVIRAAEAGKHVLCEKPCGVTAADLGEMTNACRDHGVQFMDGVMLMHTQRIATIRPFIDNEIGKLLRVYSQLSFAAGPEFLTGNIRADDSLEPHGCLGDLGWYNIRISLLAAGGKLPKSVRATTINQHQPDSKGAGVPLSMHAELYFEGNLTAGFYCSFEAYHQQWAIIGGTEGMLKINDFVLPFSNEELRFEHHKATFDVNDCHFEMLENRTIHTTPESGNNAPDSQEAKLFRQFSNIVNSGQLEPYWVETATNTQLVLDACFKSAKLDGKRLNVAKP